MSDEETPAPARPALRVITPSATPEEVAAVVAVIASLSAGSGSDAPPPVREWAAPRRTHRQPLPTGRGAWRASALPR